MSSARITRLRSRFERAWHRVDQTILRLQGRVDTPGYDRWLPWCFAVLHAGWLITAALARYNSLDLGAETAKFAQATWQITQGWKPVTTIAGGNVVAEQGSLVLYPVAGITAIFPRTETLIVLKSLALAVTVVPLWRLARRHGRLGIGATSALVFAYTIYTAVHNMNAADFSPAMLALPALMFATLAGFDGRVRLTIAAVVFALCCRADLGIAVAGLGVLFLLEGHRRLGRIIALVGAIWFLLAAFVLQPGLDGGNYNFLTTYAEFGDTPLGALWGIISHPVRFLTTIGSLEDFFVLVSLFAPVLFLPLTAPRYLMPAIPLYVLYMGADIETSRLGEASQLVPITVFVFVATVFALRQSGRILVKQVRVERRIVLALLLTAVIFFVRDSPTSPYREPWQWGERDAADEARLDAIDRLPDSDVPVRASESLLPLLSERLGVYALDTGSSTELDLGELDEIVRSATDRVDWVIYDPADEAALDAEDVQIFRTRMLENGWQVVDRSEDGGIEIYHFDGVIGALADPDPTHDDPADDDGSAAEDQGSGAGDS